MRIATKNGIQRLLRHLRELSGEQALLRQEYARILNEIRSSTPDNPTLFGYKIYSQCDEDGIISNIFSRIGKGSMVFVEIGCGNGLENNTHALSLNGWKGVWIDADRRNTEYIKRALPNSERLVVLNQFVDRQTASDVICRSLKDLQADSIDFLSVDIDGDELGVALSIIERFSPRALCIEYNAKFPPPYSVTINRKRNYWKGDDYHGASLSSLVNAFREKNYRLICCNASGTNSFFVKNSYARQFTNYDENDLYRPAAYDLRRLTNGHPASLRFLADSLEETRRDYEEAR